MLRKNNVKRFRTLFAALALAAASTVAACGQAITSTFVINEFDSVRTGGNTKQFVELFNGSAAAIDLSQYTLGFYNGTAGNDTLYMSVPLTGRLAVASYYVVGNSAVSNVNKTFADGTLKTGVNAVILYRGTTAPNVPVPTDIANFTDAIVYGQTQATDTGPLTATGEAPFQYNETFGATAGGAGRGQRLAQPGERPRFHPVRDWGSNAGGDENNIAVPLPAVLPVPEPTSLAIVGFAVAAGLWLPPAATNLWSVTP